MVSSEEAHHSVIVWHGNVSLEKTEIIFSKWHSLCSENYNQCIRIWCYIPLMWNWQVPTCTCHQAHLWLEVWIFTQLCPYRAAEGSYTEGWDLEKSGPSSHYSWLLDLSRHWKNEMMDELTLVHSTKKLQEEIPADLSKKILCSVTLAMSFCLGNHLYPITF